jgi:formamidopyrimidine-DNA glycosylase
MPELPEVEIVRRGLKAKIPGETIRSVEIFREESIGYPKPKSFAAALVGKRLQMLAVGVNIYFYIWIVGKVLSRLI